jgi:hypothetical protein
MSTADQKTNGNAVENAPTPIKLYVTQDGVNLYNVFKQGVLFGQGHPEGQWAEQEWYDALDAALPPDFVAKLDEQARKRHGK